MRVRWFEDALLDLVEIRKYVASDHPHAARDVAGRILAAADLLKGHPDMGRPGRVEGTRELVISDLPYVVPYRVRAGTVEILRVLHSAMQWPGAT